MADIKFGEVYVCHNSYVECPEGKYIQPVEATYNKKVTMQGQIVLTEADNIIGKNITDFVKCKKFGKCKLKEVTSIHWEKAKSDVKINGVRVLTGESYFICPFERSTNIIFADNKQAPGPEISKEETSLWKDPGAEMQGFLDNIVGLKDVPGQLWDNKGELASAFGNQAMKEIKAGPVLFTPTWGLEHFATGNKEGQEMTKKVWGQIILGEFSDDVTIQGTVGEIVVGIIPVAGQVADARDLIANIKKGDVEGITLSAIGFVPIIGDIVKRSKKATKAATEGLQAFKKLGKAGDIIAKYGDDALELFGKVQKAVKNSIPQGFGRALNAATEAAQNLRKRFVSLTNALDRKINTAICNLLEAGCFIEGTLVSTEYGLKKIEDIRIGEKVFTYDLVNEEIVLKEVVETFNERVSKIIKIETVNNVIIETTVEHPFYVKDIGWTEAGKLAEGDRLFSKELGDIEIISVKEEIYLDRDVHNLQLEGNHNFFVSELGLLVHNDKACAELLKKLDDDIAKLVKEGASEDVIEKLRKQRKILEENPIRKARNETVIGELKNYRTKRIVFGNTVFQLDKPGMKHILGRHSPDFWNGTTKKSQSFLPNDMSIPEIEKRIYTIMESNKEKFIRIGAGEGQVKVIINGERNVVGVRNGRIGQFYIEN